VDYAIRRGAAAVEAVEVIQGAEMNLGSQGTDGRRCSIGAREADHLVSAIDQLTDDGGPDESSRTGDEYTHV